LEVKRGRDLIIRRHAIQSNTRDGLVGMSHAEQQYQI
jgi:hypothetical protein